MTLEELKQECISRGYYLVKLGKKTKPYSCTCGNKNIHFYKEYNWISEKINIYCKCDKCKKKGPRESTKEKAKLAWNYIITH